MYEAIRDGCWIYENDKMTRYMQGTFELLFPEFIGVVKVRIFYSTKLNAFVLPNGSIYPSLGLIAKAQNEAQIASVLAHEGAHFLQNHSLLKRQVFKNAKIVFGIRNAIKDLSNYSRELELEADKISFERMRNVGYDTNQAIELFQMLEDEADKSGLKSNSKFDSHPALVDRINHFKELGKNNQKGEISQERFHKATALLKLDVLKLDLSMYRYKNVLTALENAKRISSYPPEAWFYLGEAYRQRGSQGDNELAVKAYREAITKLPEFAPAYRALAVHHLKKMQYQDSENYFAKYLNCEPNAQDRAYVLKYINELNNKADSP